MGSFHRLTVIFVLSGTALISHHHYHYHDYNYDNHQIMMIMLLVMMMMIYVFIFLHICPVEFFFFENHPSKFVVI